MALTYWHKQTSAKPLFEDLIWSRPENRQQAGKLLIIGGNAHGFAAAAEAYEQAERSGIGTARVLLPDSLQKTVGRVFEAGEYTASTPSGSFATKALIDLLEYSQWADAVLMAGDLGRNSETAILLEQFVSKYTGPLTITQDGLDYFTKSPAKLLGRDHTTIVASFAQLQKLAMGAGVTKAFRFDMDFLKLVEALHEFTERHSITIITKHLKDVFVASRGQVSTTRLEEDQDIWRVKTAARCAVWQVQNPTKTFEASTTSLVADA